MQPAGHNFLSRMLAETPADFTPAPYPEPRDYGASTNMVLCPQQGLDIKHQDLAFPRRHFFVKFMTFHFLDRAIEVHE